ncbi:MAG TPA: acylneuraminate cytidylyltransferase family protein [bacterium]|nr:acylneuraminate cytidylyltransferase family protein [bacterium]
MENLHKTNKNPLTIIVPARGGSERVPGKNIRVFFGRPLIQWTIEQAIRSEVAPWIYVSTDSHEIAAVAETSGARVIFRPESISGPEAPSEEALIHAVEIVTRDSGQQPFGVVMLQCTAPLRRPDDIRGAAALFLGTGAGSVLSVVQTRDFLWAGPPETPRALTYDPKHRPRSQEMAPVYRENGSIYITSCRRLIETGNRLNDPVRLYVMPEYADLDIDAEEDFRRGEYLMRFHAEDLGLG